jgi:hypothetical protein
MTEKEKITGTVIFGVGFFASAWFGLGDVVTDTFLALLSAIWVLPPVGNALKSIFKP